MKAFAIGIKRFLKDEEGVTMVEYGLIAALIAVVCVLAISQLGTNLNLVFQNIRDCLANPATC
jgi:pilus assembly protein Flp/PilA